MLDNYYFRFKGITYISTVYEAMSSKMKASEAKEDMLTKNKNSAETNNEKMNRNKLQDKKEDETKSSSYMLYIATILAVLGAIVSTTQIDSLNDFVEEFSSSLCASSLEDKASEVQNTTTKGHQELGLSSKFDPSLNEGDTYNALKAISSR